MTAAGDEIGHSERHFRRNFRLPELTADYLRHFFDRPETLTQNIAPARRGLLGEQMPTRDVGCINDRHPARHQHGHFFLAETSDEIVEPRRARGSRSIKCRGMNEHRRDAPSDRGGDGAIGFSFRLRVDRPFRLGIDHRLIEFFARLRAKYIDRARVNQFRYFVGSRGGENIFGAADMNSIELLFVAEPLFGSPAQWWTIEQPATARSTAAASVTSPWTSSTESGSSRRAFSSERTSARTGRPASRSARAILLPTIPVAPVTKVFCTRCVYHDRPSTARARARRWRRQRRPAPLNPAAKRGRGQRHGPGGFDLADDHHPQLRCADVLAVKRDQVVAPDRLDRNPPCPWRGGRKDGHLGRARPSALRWRQPRGRPRLAGSKRDDGRAAPLDLIGREGRMRDDAGHQPEDFLHVLSQARAGERHEVSRHADRQRHPAAVKRLGQRLGRVRFGAAIDGLGHKARGAECRVWVVARSGGDACMNRHRAVRGRMLGDDGRAIGQAVC